MEHTVNKDLKPFVAFTAGAALLFGGLCSAVQAQSTMIESGSSILAPQLAPVGGYSLNPQEYVNVSWFVAENTVSDIYTYVYTVNNPAGDVELNPNGTLTTTPETFSVFTLGFDTTVPGAVVTATTPVGGFFQNNGTSGLLWGFPSVAPGTSALIAFNSALPPVMGNASASGAFPPSPWASTPNGQLVPVPGIHAVPEPATMTVFGLTLLLLPLRFSLRRSSPELCRS